jgi:hypothetical protein
MSLFTQFLRAIGEGGVLDAIEAAEKKPTVATVLAAVGSVAGAVHGFATTASLATGASALEIIESMGDEALATRGNPFATIPPPPAPPTT